ncbi:MAG TPA: hypothetical protein PLI66_00315 [Spirochaetales bacterium]|nr:hypothetical protein [Spirochaetales bacterium]HPM71632.1 hypothetical protein [Spirochaetales bacterium]HQO65149.1 hypothetical protein [Spirochaetales bacterium]
MRMMSARRAVRRLVLRDALGRLRFRSVAWLGTAFAAWSLTLLASVSLLDTRLMPSPLAFNAIVMAIVGSLPAFLAYPARRSWGMDAIRAADSETSIEAWLGYRGGPAERLLERRALEALGLATIGVPQATRRPASARRFVAALYAVGLASFVAAQIASIGSGCGLSLGYPEREIVPAVSDASVAIEDGYPAVVEAEAEEVDEKPAEDGSAEPRPSRSAGEADENRLEEPDFVAASDGRPGDGAAEAAATDQAKAPSRSAVAGAGTRRGGAVSSGDGSGDGSGGEASSPGYEGRGRAIEPSPMLDYRARFERQYAEATGVETAIGPEPSAETVSAAITELFSSYDARVVVGGDVDPELAGLGAAWLDAFGPGAAATGERRP